MSRVAAVTGGASGLGSAICDHLARQDRRVAVLDLDGDAAELAAERLRAAGAGGPTTGTRTIAVNLTGTFNCLQAAISDMVAAGWGRIVTISSAAGQTGSLHQAHYSASKGGVIALTKTVALEYAAKGITANTIPPFTADTPMLRAAQESGRLPGADLLAQMVPAGRLGTGDDIAATCTFLCSDAAGYITGQVIGINGGAVT